MVTRKGIVRDHRVKLFPRKRKGATIWIHQLHCLTEGEAWGSQKTTLLLVCCCACVWWNFFLFWRQQHLKDQNTSQICRESRWSNAGRSLLCFSSSAWWFIRNQYGRVVHLLMDSVRNCFTYGCFFWTGDILWKCDIWFSWATNFFLKRFFLFF